MIPAHTGIAFRLAAGQLKSSDEWLIYPSDHQSLVKQFGSTLACSVYMPRSVVCEELQELRGKIPSISWSVLLSHMLPPFILKGIILELRAAYIADELLRRRYFPPGWVTIVRLLHLFSLAVRSRPYCELLLYRTNILEVREMASTAGKLKLKFNNIKR